MDYNWINTSSTDSAKKSNQSLSPSHSDLKHNISSSKFYKKQSLKIKFKVTCI